MYSYVSYQSIHNLVVNLVVITQSVNLWLQSSAKLSLEDLKNSLRRSPPEQLSKLVDDRFLQVLAADMQSCSGSLSDVELRDLGNSIL